MHTHIWVALIGLRGNKKRGRSRSSMKLGEEVGGVLEELNWGNKGYGLKSSYSCMKFSRRRYVKFTLIKRESL